MDKDFSVERPIIAVTGSSGKTTTKSFIASILRTRWIIFESSDYWNRTDHTEKHQDEINFIHRAIVLEYGMAFPGVIQKHCKIIQPNIGAITNIGTAHIGNFNGDIRGIAAAKSELIKGMDRDGHLFLNGDDKNSKLLHTKNFTGVLKKVSIHSPSDYQAKNLRYSVEGISFDLKLSGKSHTFSIPYHGEFYVYNALLAIAISDLLGFKPEEIKQGLNEVKKPKHRLDVMQLKSNITLIDDTVHAFPDAMKGALDVLTKLEGEKKVAVLGSMAGFGDKHEAVHKEIGRYVAEKKIDYLFTYGNLSKNIGAGAREAGMNKQRIFHFNRHYMNELNAKLEKIIQPNWTILIKGASGLEMVDTVEYCKKIFG
ncbi:MULTISPECIES: UDP-N-acetylmuramoyl-tripeptide--D-alanyl-D-alanine ligase [Rossellomorea]|jgi:UDP-N-acetylmuramoyl-tripeptide--D-alanyl-D-alanine ligase|uniref:UDP-N-acetylmuramoyl-tripeptide--D-alanyl-D- alanine ligase n=1 Tax=Rossellomorea TaxID=2837508 RepID=UPI0024947739|nr:MULTISPECIES: UDP-N-acetylmuramoyl-tripeptide--D-alanyl-D-alanine ligase [Rossellomorea]MDT9026121.1 UDP-N-acetylmuramoyl-tripeptide--D-alanyl-D-alanine ligase [Rossellomorea sp. YC4-1]